MTFTTSDFPFLAHSARRFLNLLTDHPSFDVKRVDKEKGERGSALIAHVAYTVSGLRERIDEVEAKYTTATTDLARQVAFKDLRLLAAYANFIKRALPWLEDAEDPPLQLGALYFIDQLSEAMLGEVADVVPTRAGEYSTEQRPFLPLFPNLKLVADSSARRAVILNFPALEANSFPLLPLFGHEIGHTVVTKYGLTTKALSAANRRAGFTAAKAKAVQIRMGKTGDDELRARYVIDESIRNWTVELLCDQLALQYLGPSYLLAFSAFVLPLTWNTPGERHPPTTFRVGHLLRSISRSPWESLLEERMPVAFDWLTELASGPSLEPGSALQEVLEALDAAREDIAAAARDQLGANVYNANAYLAESRHLDDQLRFNVIPVQHPSKRTAFDLRAVLIAGWLSLHDEAASSQGGESASTLCGALEMPDSHAFFTKALELSRVLGAWEGIE